MFQFYLALRSILTDVNEIIKSQNNMFHDRNTTHMRHHFLLVLEYSTAERPPELTQQHLPVVAFCYCKTWLLINARSLAELL